MSETRQCDERVKQAVAECVAAEREACAEIAKSLAIALRVRAKRNPEHNASLISCAKYLELAAAEIHARGERDGEG